MSADRWDAIVVGAGPAGSSAAATLGAAGRRVLLLDKSTFPREKTCGDGIIYRVLRGLKQLGVLEAFRERVVFRSKGYSLCFRDNTQLTLRKAAGAEAMIYVLPRLAFDQVLLEGALRHPSVEFRPGVTALQLVQEGEAVVGVKVAAGPDTDVLRAKVVVDASGANTSLATQVGAGNRDPARCAYALRGYYNGVAGLGDTIEIYFDDEILPGYFWIFPTSATSANVGCGTFLHLIDERKIDLRQVLRRFFEDHPVASAKLRHATPDGPLKGGKIPLALGGDERPRVRPGFIMVGDAASFTDPITAEGISFAVYSGIAAGEVVDRACAAGDWSACGLSEFDRRWKAHFTPKFAKGKFLTESQGKGAFVEALLASFNESAVVEDSVGDLSRQYELVFRLKGAMKVF